MPKTQKAETRPSSRKEQFSSRAQRVGLSHQKPLCKDLLNRQRPDAAAVVHGVAWEAEEVCSASTIWDRMVAAAGEEVEPPGARKNQRTIRQMVDSTAEIPSQTFRRLRECNLPLQVEVGRKSKEYVVVS